MDTLYEDTYTFVVVSHRILIRMRNVSEKLVEKMKKKTHFFMFNNFFSENRAVFEIVWKNMIQPDRPQMTVSYSACALHVGQLRLQTRSWNV